MALVALFTIDLFLPGGLVEGSDTLEVARTAGFTTLVLAQLFNALNARSETTSAFHGLFANKWLWGAMLLGVVLQVAVVEVPFLQVAFGTASMDLAHWGACVAWPPSCSGTTRSARCSQRTRESTHVDGHRLGTRPHIRRDHDHPPRQPPTRRGRCRRLAARGTGTRLGSNGGDPARSPVGGAPGLLARLPRSSVCQDPANLRPNNHRPPSALPRRTAAPRRSPEPLLLTPRWRSPAVP